MIKKNFAIIVSFLTMFTFGILIFKPAIAQDASLLPPAVQQFFDKSGNPLASGKVYFYEVGTSTFKDTYNSSAAVTPYQNPITLNAAGMPPGNSGIYGIGLYRQLVKDRNNNTIWDAVTAPGGGGGSSPTGVGDGNLVGTTLPWSGLIAPNQYVFAYGQEISRTTYPEFYTAVTQQANVICSASSNTLTGIADTSQIPIGAAIELALCVVAGTTVASKTASTVTLSNPSSVSINAVATFFPYGNGNGSTTFNVPDLRGYVLAGRNNMGGTASSRLTTTYYLNNPDALGAVGGLQSHTQTISEMALHDHNGVTGAGTHNHDIHGERFANIATGGAVSVPALSVFWGPAGSQNFGVTDTTSITLPISPSGISAPFTIIQPTITLNYIIKVTPDTSTSIATGVYSIGGMTGVISCGTGILCTGNIISFNGNVLAGGSTGSIQYRNSDGSFGGSPNAIFISPDNLTLGAAGTSFLFDIFGSTSGRVRQTVPAVAGTTNIAWGNTSGTPAVTATTPIVLNSTTGNLTCPTCATSTLNAAALTKTDDTNITVTLGGSPTTALLNATSMTLGWTGTLAAGRLNSNVVQAITNDTNVTGSIAAQNLTLGWTGQLGLTRGGTNASLTVSNGGLVYSTASAMAILAGTATAGQIPRSGSSSAPSWSTSTYPATTAAGTVLTSATANTIAGTATPILGVAGATLGTLGLSGSTSGVVTITPQATAGTVNFTLPNTSGTPAISVPSPLSLSATTGAVTWGGLTSGGILYNSSTTTVASSALLAANQIMIGGGAGAAPTTFACATSTTVVHGGTPPSCSQIVAADITTNTVTNSNLSQVGAATIKGNPTASTANAQDFTFGSLTQTVSPNSTDWIPIYDNATGTIKKINAGSIASSSVAGVSSIAGNTGAFTLSTGLTNSVNDLRVDIATAGNFQAGTANKVLDANVVFSTETATTYGTTTSFDFNTFINTRVTLTGNITTMNCSNMKAGQAGTITFIQDGSGNRTSVFCSILKFAGGVAPTLSTPLNSVDVLSYSCRSTTFCVAGLLKAVN